MQLYAGTSGFRLDVLRFPLLPNWKADLERLAAPGVTLCHADVEPDEEVDDPGVEFVSTAG